MFNPELSIITTTDPRSGQLLKLLAALSSLAIQEHALYQVVVVDDLGQWKKTNTLNRNNYPSLYIDVITPVRNVGQINATLMGLEQASAPLLLTIDPDMHPCVSEIPAMRKMLTDHVIAIHAVRKYRPDAKLYRLLASSIINWATRKLTGLEIQDLGSPITLFRREALVALDPQIGSQTNIKIYGYMTLGSRLGSYSLLNTSAKESCSNYRFPQLAHAAIKLLKDCIYLRRHLCKT